MNFDDYGHVTDVTVQKVDMDARYYTKQDAEDRYVNVQGGDTMSGTYHWIAGSELTMESDVGINIGGGQLILDATSTLATISSNSDALDIKNDLLSLKSEAGETYITATTNGAVSIYHDNALRLETDLEGINITDDLDVAGNTVINGTLHTDGTATLASAVVEDLDEHGIVYAGSSTGDLVTDTDFTYDGFNVQSWCRSKPSKFPCKRYRW